MGTQDKLVRLRHTAVLYVKYGSGSLLPQSLHHVRKALRSSGGRTTGAAQLHYQAASPAAGIDALQSLSPWSPAARAAAGGGTQRACGGEEGRNSRQPIRAAYLMARGLFAKGCAQLCLKSGGAQFCSSVRWKEREPALIVWIPASEIM